MHLVLSVLTLYILTLIHMHILHSPEEFVQQSRPDNRFLILGKFVGLTYLRTIMKMTTISEVSLLFDDVFLLQAKKI